MATPALPPGFVLEDDETPPLPPGFVLESALPKPRNNANDSPVAQLIKGKAQQRKSNPLLMASPIGAVGALIDMAQGRAPTDSAARASLHSVTGALHGGAELVERGVQAGANAVLPEGNAVRQYIDSTVNSDIAAGKRNEADYRANMPDTTSASVGKYAGNLAVDALAFGRLGGLPRAQQYVASAGVGGLLGGAQPIVEGESRGENAAWGGGLGLLGQAGGDLLLTSGRAAAQKVTPELRALYERARAGGINLTPAQLSNSEFVKRISAQLGKLPLSGGRALAERQQAAGNREIARLLGQDADAVTPNVMARAADDIGQTFDQVFQDGMRYDRQFLRELGSLRQEVAGLDDTAKNAFDILLKRIRTQSQNGTLTGRTLQSIDQQARRWASGGGDRQHAAEAFRESLHEAFGRQAPAGTKAAWDQARRQWATLKTLEPVVARNTEGGIPLAQLQGAVTSTKAGKTARARGRDGDLGQLASIGQRVKAPSTSGTAENLWATQALNPLAWPLLGLGSAGGLASRATINNAGLAPLLMREGRGQTRQAIAPYVRPGLLGLLPYLPRKATASEGDRKRP